MALVFGAFLATTLVVPVFAPVPISDDWLWARAVEWLVREGSLRLPDLTAPTLLFQLLWGAGFSWLFEPTFGVLRLSTIVLVMLSGLAFYGLCRECCFLPSSPSSCLFRPSGHPD